MSTTTTATKIKSLREMGKMTGQQLYLRIKLASEILEDRQYVDAKHRGDEFRCATWLEEECFPDLGGAYSLVELVEMYRLIPGEGEWAEVKYNLRAMYTLYSRRRRRESNPERVSPPRRTSADSGDPLAPPAGSVADELRQLRERNAELAAENEQLRGQNETLFEENLQLRERITALEVKSIREREGDAPKPRRRSQAANEGHNAGNVEPPGTDQGQEAEETAPLATEDTTVGANDGC